jgi:hypothetical protein
MALVATKARALPPEEKEWQIDLALYGWLAQIDLDVEAGGVERDFEVSFKEIFENLGWAAMGGVEGRYQRALLLVDVVGMQIVQDQNGNGRTRPFQVFENGPGGTVDLGAWDVHTRLTTWILDVKPGFRVLSMPTVKLLGRSPADDDRRRFDLDLFLGFRYWNVANKTNVEIDPATFTVGGTQVDPPGGRFDLGGLRVPGAFLNGTDRSVQEDADWFDPIVGARVGAGITKRWSLHLSGDIGGFDIADDSSNLTWQAMLQSRIAITDHVSLTSGYRGLGVDRDSAIDGIIHGPQLGALFTF